MIGLDLQVRPVQPTDADAIRRMFSRLSPETIHRRFFTLLPSLDDRTLHRLVDVDHEWQEAVVAIVGREIIGLASFHRWRDDPATADVAIVVEDAWQHHGIGRHMARRLARVAATRGVERLHADVLADNRSASGLIRRVASGSKARFADGTLSYDLPVSPAA